jgi:uncharacterized SAM-binding protein YcdF (DUF218 family)
MMVLFIVVFISFIVIEMAIISEMNAPKVDPIEDIDFIIILGAGLDGDQISRTLKQRLDKSVDVIKHNKDTRVIVSGGQGEGELISEAEAMGEYLINLHIPYKRLIFENKSTTTKENLSYSKGLIDDLGIENPQRNHCYKRLSYV